MVELSFPRRALIAFGSHLIHLGFAVQEALVPQVAMLCQDKTRKMTYNCQGVTLNKYEYVIYWSLSVRALSMECMWKLDQRRAVAKERPDKCIWHCFCSSPLTELNKSSPQHLMLDVLAMPGSCAIFLQCWNFLEEHEPKFCLDRIFFAKYRCLAKHLTSKAHPGPQPVDMLLVWGSLKALAKIKMIISYALCIRWDAAAQAIV